MLVRIIADANAFAAEAVLDEEEVTKAHKDLVKEMNASIDAVSKSVVVKTEENVLAKDDNSEIEETLPSAELCHDSRTKDVSRTLQLLQEKKENLAKNVINLKSEMNTKLDMKVDNVARKEANDELERASTRHDVKVAARR